VEKAMFLFVFKKIGPALILLFICISCASTKPISIKEELNDHSNDFEQQLDMFASDPDATTNALLARWSDFVKMRSSYSNLDFQLALDELQAEYSTSITKTEKCMHTIKDSQKNHTSGWLDDLINRFGVEYIQRNRQAVLENIALLYGIPEKRCADEYKEMIYKESRLFRAYRSYFQLFFYFYDTLDKAEKARLKSRRETAETILSMLKKGSMANIVFGSGRPHIKLAEVRAKRLSKELYDYFKGYMNNHDLDPIKAAKDLSKINKLGRND
jgi:hypothetical protein